MNTYKTVLFIGLYYFVWFSCLHFAKQNMGIHALVLSCLISMLQSTFFLNRKNRMAFTCWLIGFSAVGYLTDSIFQLTGMLQFKANAWGIWLAPPWILALWINFSDLCFGIKNFLINQLKYMPLFGLFGFPLAYMAGGKLDAALFLSPVLGPMLQGFVWAILFPACIYWLQTLKQYGSK